MKRSFKAFDVGDSRMQTHTSGEAWRQFVICGESKPHSFWTQMFYDTLVNFVTSAHWATVRLLDGAASQFAAMPNGNLLVFERLVSKDSMNANGWQAGHLATTRPAPAASMLLCGPPTFYLRNSFPWMCACEGCCLHLYLWALCRARTSAFVVFKIHVVCARASRAVILRCCQISWKNVLGEQTDEEGSGAVLHWDTVCCFWVLTHSLL